MSVLKQSVEDIKKYLNRVVIGDSLIITSYEVAKINLDDEIPKLLLENVFLEGNKGQKLKAAIMELTY